MSRLPCKKEHCCKCQTQSRLFRYIYIWTPLEANEKKRKKIILKQVQIMVNGAEKFAKEDKETTDAIDTKNQADSVVYQTEKRLRERETKPPPLLLARHSGSQTSVRVAKDAMTNTSKTAFGATIILDDALTVGLERTSKIVGSAQGIYAFADLNG